MKTLPILLALFLAAPALADPSLDHDAGLQEPEVLASPIPTPAPTATPSPTPMPPLCSDTNPSLTRCLAVMDPAQALNQRVTALEQRDGQIINALNELAKKVDAQQAVKKK